MSKDRLWGTCGTCGTGGVVASTCLPAITHVDIDSHIIPIIFHLSFFTWRCDLYSETLNQSVV